MDQLFSTSLIFLKMKGRDIQGDLVQLGAGNVPNTSAKMVRGGPAPSEPTLFASTGTVPAAAIELMKKLGIM